MKKTILLLTIIAIALECNAQLLWKITGNGSEKTSYIFGSHHLAPLSVADKLNITQLIAAAEEVYGELSLDDLNRATTDMSIIQAMTAPADSTLDKVFTPAELQEIDDAFQKLSGASNGSVTAMMNTSKPYLLNTMFMMTAMAKAYPEADLQKPLDKVLLSYANALGKPVKGLETMTTQIKALYGASIARQAADLLRTARSGDGGIAEIRKLTETYLSGNLNDILALMTDPATGMDYEERTRLIDERNDAWVSFLLGMLPTTSMLIIVGAGHLPGTKGLLNQLRNHGYDVAPVSPATEIK